ncbi:MAG: insulinase family protein, partial [Clostridia bacterium]|nr:insulinase family protein [Clostridia bacterium]
MIRLPIADNVYLNYIPQTRFKANYLTMNFLTPLDGSTAANNALVPRVLAQGCRAYPTTIALAERLQSLYNLSLSRNRVFKRGETQVICQSAWMLDNSMVPDNTDILGGALDMMGEIWFRPMTEGSGFVTTFTEHAKNDTVDRIRALINNKSNYAPYRCNQEMCRGERYGISVVGTEQDVLSATAESVYDAYRSLLSGARCEIFYVGRGGEDRVAAKFADLFSSVERVKPQPLSTEVIREVKSVKEIIE